MQFLLLCKDSPINSSTRNLKTTCYKIHIPGYNKTIHHSSMVFLSLPCIFSLFPPMECHCWTSISSISSSSSRVVCRGLRCSPAVTRRAAPVCSVNHRQRSLTAQLACECFLALSSAPDNCLLVPALNRNSIVPTQQTMAPVQPQQLQPLLLLRGRSSARDSCHWDSHEAEELVKHFYSHLVWMRGDEYELWSTVKTIDRLQGIPWYTRITGV